jgi:ABC-type lipoprotein release transport system permease subunit
MALPLAYNLRNLKVRWKVTLLAVGGIALVVAVFVILLSMAAGFRLALRATGSDGNAIVVQRGSGSELTSWIDAEDGAAIVADPRIGRGPGGEPLVSPEIVVVVNLPKAADGQPTNVTLRGVTPRAFVVRAGVRIVRGRGLTPGLDEFIVGRRIQERVRGLDPGARVRMQGRDWTVAGVFEAGGGAFESEIWGDREAMAEPFRRRGGQNSLTVRLTDPAALASFDADLQRNPRLQVRAAAERAYYEEQSGPVAGPLMGLALFVAIVMGTGAVFGAMNTMYAIVAARTREVGTLRALGFPRRSILAAFVVESVAIALTGGALGCLLALPMNGFVAGTGNTAGFAELAWAFRITPANLAGGLLFSAVMGLLGGLLPAVRAARMPITTALREA